MLYETLMKQRSDNAMMDLTERVVKMEHAGVEKQIIQLKNEYNEVKCRCRRVNLRIHGVAQTVNGNLSMRVNNIARVLNIPELADVNDGRFAPASCETWKNAWHYRPLL